MTLLLVASQLDGESLLLNRQHTGCSTFMNQAGTDLMADFHSARGRYAGFGGGGGEKGHRWYYPVVNHECYKNELTGKMCPKV